MISTQVQVNKKVKDELEKRHAEFPYDFPENVQEALEKYGENVVRDLIYEAITLRLQAPARKILEAAAQGSDFNEVVGDVMKNHRIDVKRPRGTSLPKVSPYQQIAMGLADPEQRDAIIEKFRSLGINLDLNGTPTEAQETSGRRAR